MRYLGMFSSGLSSFYATWQMKQDAERDGVEPVVIFCDTKMENKDNYRFAEDVKKFLGIKFIQPTDGRDPYEVFEDVRYFGNSIIAPCSKILKFQASVPYVENGDKMYFGINWTEAHRAENIQRRWLEEYPKQTFSFPLIDKEVKLKEWSRSLGIEPPSDYSIKMDDWTRTLLTTKGIRSDIEFRHANCNQGCIKAGLGHYVLLYMTDKERYLEHENRQDQSFKRAEAKGVKPKPFLKKTINGKSEYLSLRDFREKIIEPALNNNCLPEFLTIEDFNDGPCVCMGV